MTVRVGVIGTGVGRAHLRGYRACPEAKVWALCDVNEKRLQTVGDQFDIPFRFTDYQDMLAMKELDAISVALPNYLHAPVTIAALTAGKHVLCEKPLAATLADAEEMVAASQRTGQTLMVTFNYRYRADTRFIKTQVEKGALGPVYHVRAGWVRRRGIPKVGGWFTRKAKSGGGPLIDLGVHIMDLVMWMLDYPQVLTVSGATHNALATLGKGSRTPFDGTTDFDVEDVAIAFLRLAGGTSVALEISWASHSSASDDYYLHLLGAESGAELSVHNYATEDTVRLYGELADHPVEIRPTLNNEMTGHEGAVREFVASILEEREPSSPGEQGLVVAQLLDAIYRSAETNQEIDLSSTGSNV
jgi:predicted dehydrogenase